MSRLPIVLIASLVTSGCFSSATLVKVRADGSGTIDVTGTVRKGASTRLRLRPASLDELHDVAGVQVSLDGEVRIEPAVR